MPDRSRIGPSVRFPVLSALWCPPLVGWWSGGRFDAEGGLRGWAEPGRQRRLATRFGEVVVTRIAYRARGRVDLHPADAVLNLPVEKHSHGLRRLAAVEAARGSFADAAAAVERATTVRVGKRQVEALAARQDEGSTYVIVRYVRAGLAVV